VERKGREMKGNGKTGRTGEGGEGREGTWKGRREEGKGGESCPLELGTRDPTVEEGEGKRARRGAWWGVQPFNSFSTLSTGWRTCYAPL